MINGVETIKKISFFFLEGFFKLCVLHWATRLENSNRLQIRVETVFQNAPLAPILWKTLGQTCRASHRSY
jgi:hypothetical protein